MLLAHFVQPDAVGGVIDHDLVPAVTVDRLLQTEGEMRVLAVVAEHRVKVLHDAQLPVAFGGNLRDRREAFWTRSRGKKGRSLRGACASCGAGGFLLLGPHAPCRSDEHGLARYDRIDPYLADRFLCLRHLSQLLSLPCFIETDFLKRFAGRSFLFLLQQDSQGERGLQS